MKILESMSSNTGLRIRKLKPLEQFFPTPEKYITLESRTSIESKNYDYWLDVLDYIRAPLEKMGYKILHIGKDCAELPFCVNLINKLNLHQTNYVLRNSKLHIGGDSAYVHIAGKYGTPLLVGYGPTSPNTHGTYFGTQVSLEPDGKPSYRSDENPKTINTIEPERFANAILNQIGSEDKIPDKTIFVGPQYSRHFIEVVPNTVVNPQSLAGQIPTMRCDYFCDENIMAYNLANAKFSIITDKETNLDLYKRFRDNIQNINFKVSLDSDIKYVKKLRNIGVEVRLWTDDKDQIDQIRFKYIDLDQIHLVESPKFEVEIKEGMFYRSMKIILSDNKVYISKQAYLEDRPISSPNDNFLEIQKIDIDFLKELEYFRVFEKC